MFENLKEKSIIKKNYNPESYVPNDIEFNKNFLKKYYKQSGVLEKSYLITMNHLSKLMERWPVLEILLRNFIL